GSLALGETYMKGWWESAGLDELIKRMLRAELKEKLKSWKDELRVLQAKLINYQSRVRAFQVGKKHYDLGNDLYDAMLDKRMIYSCGYWKNANNLDEAQEAKLDLVCRKLRIEPGMTVLDIGCGWGGTARFIAERCGAKVVGVTVSEEQAELARMKNRGLPVEIRLADYRSLDGKFDRILSIGMFEHVGYKNYPVFMKIAGKLLKEDGLFLLHTIGANHSTSRIDPWIERYIFPNANLPSARQLSSASENIFVMEDWHNFGPYYDTTLLEWYGNFERNWPSLKGKYGEEFYRMWKYYLLSCAGSFRARYCQLWQVVFSPKGTAESCEWPR
ncbi:MAG: cyclopropane fatty acyl phospholipid synthase, partial [Desulfobulbales bacterium]|nr:cyclopropane fatty acyl phospholipid synthase [Desulfobulbales bacterium]